MNRDGGFFTDGTRYIILGILFILFIGLVMMIPKGKGKSEEWLVEAHVIKKETVKKDGEEIYLLHTEDRDGNENVYQITQDALKGQIEAEDALKEIRRGKYYRFKVVDGEEYGCDYPCVRGAATLIDGFSQETAAAE